jgi:K+-sensing histidine kinase KdpD
MNLVTAEPAATRRRLLALGAGLSRRRRLAGALTGLVVLPLLTLGLAQLRDVLELPSQMLLYLLAVVVVALVGGLVPALAAAVAAAVLLDHYFIPPLGDFTVADPDNVVALVAFVLVAGAVGSVVGLAARRTREAETLATANAASREELRVLADEQGRGSSPASATAPTSRRWAAASTSSRRCLWRSPGTRAVRPLDDFSQATDAYGDHSLGWESGRWSQRPSSSRVACGARSAPGPVASASRPTPNSA